MQGCAPEAVDFANENDETKRLYGVGDTRLRIRSASSACWRGGLSSEACDSFNSGAAPMSTPLSTPGTRTTASSTTMASMPAKWISRSPAC